MRAISEVLVAEGAGASTLDAAAFDSLLQREKQRLYGIAYSILRDHSEAEDAVQDVALRAWRSWGDLIDVSAAPAWLTRICVNACINHRAKLRLRRHPEPHPDVAAPADPAFSGRLVDLDRSYRRLSTQQRAAIFLHYHYGYSIDECAGLMGCGAGSVRTHLARAIASMRKGMTHD